MPSGAGGRLLPIGATRDEAAHALAKGRAGARAPEPPGRYPAEGFQRLAGRPPEVVIVDNRDRFYNEVEDVIAMLGSNQGRIRWQR